jgi:hypothetical protein
VRVRGAQRGIVLVAVIVTCAALWILATGLALTALTHYRAALATVAVSEAQRAWEARLALLRALPVSEWPERGGGERWGDGTCVWSWEVLERSEAALVVRLRVSTPATSVVREATLHAP